MRMDDFFFFFVVFIFVLSVRVPHLSTYWATRRSPILRTPRNVSVIVGIKRCRCNEYAITHITLAECANGVLMGKIYASIRANRVHQSIAFEMQLPNAAAHSLKSAQEYCNFMCTSSISICVWEKNEFKSNSLCWKNGDLFHYRKCTAVNR